MISLWQMLALGLLLGVRHAFDPDHLVAITTIVSEHRNPFRAIWIGVSWGLGHTTSLLLVGTALLVLNLHLDENIAQMVELAVGPMLILLGVQTLLTFRRSKVHVHLHRHSAEDPQPHRHFHPHQTSIGHAHHTLKPRKNLARLLFAGMIPGRKALEDGPGVARPSFRLKSYLVGIVHGLAGSAALMLLVLASLQSTWTGIMYILVFGVGTAVSMGLISIFICLPFSVSHRVPRLDRFVRPSAGVLSIVFGAGLIWQFAIA